jgi:hypothetical protein
MGKSFEEKKKARTSRAFIGGCQDLPNIQPFDPAQPRSRIFEACGPFWPWVTSNCTR